MVKCVVLIYGVLRTKIPTVGVPEPSNPEFTRPQTSEPISGEIFYLGTLCHKLPQVATKSYAVIPPWAGPFFFLHSSVSDGVSLFSLTNCGCFWGGRNN
jgi:hypothetical protein